MMLPIRRAGRLVEVRGQDDARAVPGIEGLTVTIPRGAEIVPLPEGDRYLGFMFARGETPAEVEAALREAHERLEVVVEQGLRARQPPKADRPACRHHDPTIVSRGAGGLGSPTPARSDRRLTPSHEAGCDPC